MLAASVYVCPSVCVCVSMCKSMFQPWVFRILPYHKFMLASPNLDQKCKTHWLRSPFCLECHWPWSSPPEKIHNHQTKYIIVMTTSTASQSGKFHGLHPLHIYFYPDHFMVPAVSKSQPSARILILAAECISAFSNTLVRSWVFYVTSENCNFLNIILPNKIILHMFIEINEILCVFFPV